MMANTHATTSRIRSCCRPLWADECGATAIEYALLAAVVGILAIGGLQALSSSTGGLYGTMEAISAAIEDALAG